MAKNVAAGVSTDRIEADVARHARLFSDGLIAVASRRRPWDAFQELSREVYDRVIKASRIAGLFDVLHIDPETSRVVSPS